MIFDPMYILYVMLPGMAIGLWAQWKLKRTYSKTSRMPSQRGMTGAQAAQLILDRSGIPGVHVEETHGFLSDHYDPRHKVLRLSREVYHGHSLASLGVAAHEAGHALQDAQNYSPLVVRNAVVPLAGFGSQASFIVLIAGMILNWSALLLVGICLFALVVFFQLVNLPCEFDASHRARVELEQLGVVTRDEIPWVRKVLNAAAMTYVAGLITSILTLAYYIMRYMAMSRD